MWERILTNAVKAGRFVADNMPKVNRTIIKGSEITAPIVGKGVEKGIKGTVKVANKALGKFAEFSTSEMPIKMASRAGKFSAQAARDIEYTARGVNNILGTVTSGKEIKSLNKGLNKMLDTNRFDGHRYFQLLKDSEDSILLGKRATKLGAGVILTGGAIMGTKDAVSERLQAQRGTVVGSAGNAPVNNYAYQGASYADNAGATGDLVLNMHRQRHGGFL